MTYEEFYTWAFAVGKNIIEKDREGKLLRELIYDIRGEETPGRFLNKLVNKLTEYRTNQNINLDVSIKPKIVKENWHGDKFYYLKSSILAGFLNALSGISEGEEI